MTQEADVHTAKGTLAVMVYRYKFSYEGMITKLTTLFKRKVKETLFGKRYSTFEVLKEINTVVLISTSRTRSSDRKHAKRCSIIPETIS